MKNLKNLMQNVVFAPEDMSVALKNAAMSKPDPEESDDEDYEYD